MSNRVEFIGRFYTWDPQFIGQYEENLINKLCKEIEQTSDFPNNVVINLTWLEFHNSDTLEKIFSKHNKHTTKFWFIGLIDETYSVSHNQTFIKYKNLGYNLALVGNSEEHYYSIFIEMLYDKNINLPNLNLERFQYYYLCYNRKPKTHRENLVQLLIKNNLINKGFVTYQQGVFPEVDKISLNHEKNFYNNLDRNDYNHLDLNSNNHRAYEGKFLSRPEDIVTLGDLKIWQTTYLVLVTETFDYCDYQTSEKVWKPIFGKRPYLLVSHPTVVNILHKLEFYSPGDIFQDANLDKCDAKSNVIFMKKLLEKSPTQILNLYHRQQEMMEYNHNRFLDLARKRSNPILNWGIIRR